MPATQLRRVPIPRGQLVDYSAALLMIAGIGWLLLVAEANGGNAWPYVSLLVSAAASYILASVTSRYHPWLVPLAIVAAAIAYAFWRRGTLLESPHSGPLGYSNAYASLCLLTSAAALVLFSRTADFRIRNGAAVAAVAFAAIPFLNLTLTASVLVLALPLGLLCRDERRVRMAIKGSASAVVATLISVLILVLLRRSNLFPALVNLSERRVQLWDDALALFFANPLTGVGPSRFPETSATALMNTDTAWPHGEVLHFASEAGLPGALIILALFAWALARLWWGAGDTATAISAIAIGATGVHANVDYILHFPAVAMAATALVAAGASKPHRRYPGRARPHPGPRRTVSGHKL